MTRPPSRRAAAWEAYPDARLLELRFCDLGLTEPGPFLAAAITTVWRELDAKGLPLRPRTWLSDEWFSPDGIAGIALPFYLAHPRLVRLERRMMNGAEGGTRNECRRLLRHEVAHALQHAYRLERRPAWREAFGRSSTRYPSRYRPDPGSRSFVLHLRDWYAQCHPDEDFAETFAVWLAPRSGWRRRYAGWPALAKLEYVDQLMSELAARPLPRVSRRMVDPLDRLTVTLGAHYRARRRRFGLERPTRLDDPLRRLLGSERPARAPRRGTALLREARSAMRQTLGPMTPAERYAFEMVYLDLVARARTLGLAATKSRDAVARDGAAFLRGYLAALMHDPTTWEWIPV